MKNLLPFTETFKWIAMESIVGGHFTPVPEGVSVNMRGPEKFVP